MKNGNGFVIETKLKKLYLFEVLTLVFFNRYFRQCVSLSIVSPANTTMLDFGGEGNLKSHFPQNPGDKYFADGNKKKEEIFSLTKKINHKHIFEKI